MQLHIETPLVLHPTLSTLHRRVWLKLENLQPTGSFKARGIGALCSAAKKEGKTSVVCPSGGNAGLTAAYAARRLGLNAHIVVPDTTPPLTRELILAQQADLIVHGHVWDESNEFALTLAQQKDAAYVSAFDHPVIWEGHSTLVDEVLRDVPHADAFVVSVGGGGLLGGVIRGLQRHSRTDCHLVAVETEGAASFRAAIDAGEPVSISEISTLATTLGARKVAKWPLEQANRFRLTSIVLSDEAAVQGVFDFARDMRMLVEPACGVSLSAVYSAHPSLQNAHDVVIVVCGGVGVNMDLMDQWRKLHRRKESELVGLSTAAA